MKNFPLITTLLPLYEDAGFSAVDGIVAMAQLSRSYRILWLETENEPCKRKLVIQPPGTLPDLQTTLGHKGYAITFPEEFLLLFGFNDSYPFRLTEALPGFPIIAVNMLDCATSRTIGRTIASLVDQCHLLPKGHLVLSGLLKVLLVSVSRLFQHTEQSQVNCADRQLFERFVDLIRQHGVSKKGIQDYAKTLSIRTDVLSETVKRVSGFPASHHIYQHIIRTAKHAAIGSGATMKEVAFGLGFKDVAHFSKFFRNKTGMTFSDYKKAYQFI